MGADNEGKDKFVYVKEKLIEYNKADILVIALVYPAGVEKKDFVKELKSRLKGDYDYEHEEINISHNLYKWAGIEKKRKRRKKIKQLKNKPEFKMYKYLLSKEKESDRVQKMLVGSCLRKKYGSHYLAYKVIDKIFESKNNKDKKCKKIISYKKAYIVSSLKTPEELMVLQTVFGKNFYLVSLYNSEENRKLGGHAEDIIKIDQKESEADREYWGQNTSDVFHRAHYCFSVMQASNIGKEVERFLKLIFGFPFLAPRLDEYGCYLAFKVALKSMDLSRQVGAVIINDSGDVLSIGANDVQAVGQGYWNAQKDYRDYAMGFEPNKEIVKKWIEELKEDYENQKDKEISSELEKLIEKKFSLTEFGRAIHAEMDALVTAHRNGVSCKGATLYVTTFPCHNCAKHIAAAGIKRVVFVEPYDKSRTFELHPDLFTMDDSEACTHSSTCNHSNACNDKGNGHCKVLVSPFVGLGHYKFRDFFSVAGRGLKGGINRKQELEELEPVRDIQDIAKVVKDRASMAFDEYETQIWNASDKQNKNDNKSNNKQNNNEYEATKKLRYFSFKHEIIGNYLALKKAIENKGK